MSNWVVVENPKQDSYREFEMIYLADCLTRVGRKIVRLWPDGSIEVGTCNSPFTVEWTGQVARSEKL